MKILAIDATVKFLSWLQIVLAMLARIATALIVGLAAGKLIWSGALLLPWKHDGLFLALAALVLAGAVRLLK